MNYKVIRRGQPGVVGGGDIKYYASPVYGGEVDLAELGKQLSSRSTVTKTDAVAVLTGLEELITEELLDGKIVKLGVLGSFRISLSSEGKETPDEVTSTAIKNSKVIFRPSTEITYNLGRMRFAKAKDLQANPDEEVVDNFTGGIETSDTPTS